ncbi:sulfurtransferase TusA family protein [Shewanella sedimentimangrovi]|uniref:Sulfurtransferase TusA family protein n=1 Tax=Shewanella sedimentimangrovi TaxID=2814293 RepID=A0ABX7R6J4_9GAMM|nr:sulfurtransferase TusA family protein [Shewanella sedimentimangrovi]QSX38770.1 sulfurtransferase TusA family protein [Shewanella sedimentimangrovi]
MVSIDLTAQRCPLALVKAKMALKPLAIGDSLQITLLDSGSRRDVPAYFQNQGHVLTILKDDEQSLSLIVTKTTQG